MASPDFEAVRVRFALAFQETLVFVGVAVLLYVIGLFLLVVARYQDIAWGPLEWFLLIAWLAVVIGLSGIAIDAWRCPVCDRYLGRGFFGMGDLTYCMSCGARLM